MQALMLAASVDGVAAIHLLLKHGATIELQVNYARVHLPAPRSCLMNTICHLVTWSASMVAWTKDCTCL